MSHYGKWHRELSIRQYGNEEQAALRIVARFARARPRLAGHAALEIQRQRLQARVGFEGKFKAALVFLAHIRQAEEIGHPRLHALWEGIKRWDIDGRSKDYLEQLIIISDLLFAFSCYSHDNKQTSLILEGQSKRIRSLTEFFSYYLIYPLENLMVLGSAHV